MISKDYEQRVERGWDDETGVVLVSGAVIQQGRGHANYGASPRNPTPRALHVRPDNRSGLISARCLVIPRAPAPRRLHKQPARDFLLTVIVAVSSSGYLVRVLRPLSLDGSGRGAHGAGGQGGYRGRGREAVLTPRARGARGLGEEEKRAERVMTFVRWLGRCVCVGDRRAARWATHEWGVCVWTVWELDTRRRRGGLHRVGK